MRASQLYWNEASGWSDAAAEEFPAGLVLYFGARAMLSVNNPYAALQSRFKDAHILGCGSGDCQLHNQTMTVTVLGEQLR